MGLDPREWRILREMEQRLEAEDPDLAALLSPGPAEPAVPGRPAGIRTWAMSLTMAIVLVGLMLIGRVASTSPPNKPEAGLSTPDTSETAPYGRTGFGRRMPHQGLHTP